MQAIAEAKSLYMLRGLDFEERLGWYLMNGLVINFPDRFIMAKPIRSSVGDADWEAGAEADCYYIECAVGKGCLRWFLSQAPVRLPKLAWRRFKDRKNGLKYADTATFERLV